MVSGMYWNRGNAFHAGTIQAIEFADGTVWGWSDILAQPLHIAEGSYDNNGYAPVEGGMLVGNEADNFVHGSRGNDILHGGAGNDRLYDSGNSNDVLWGGAGDDRLEGGTGDDTYIFQRGDGVDTITEQSGNDSILFGEGVDFADIWFARSGNDLVIDVLGSEDRVKISSWFTNANYQVESISAGGMAIVNTQMNQMLQAMAGFGVPEGMDGRFTEEQKEAMAPVLSTYWKPTGS